jgi:hypothetical protein
LVKDNIATDDQMQTTAGSFAIYGNHVPGDAVIIQQLRAARTTPGLQRALEDNALAAADLDALSRRT